MMFFDHDGLAEELTSLGLAEAARLRESLGELPAALQRLVDATASAHARRVVAERQWLETGGGPTSPWLRVAREALADYQRGLRLLLQYARPPESVADPLAFLGGVAGDVADG